MSVRLSEARVLLTGASGGIGQAIARALHARGASLILTGRRADLLEPLAAEVSGTALAADLGSAADVRRLLAEAGQVDILIANAALPGSGYVLDYSEQEIDQVLAVNLRAPVIMTRHLLPQMCERGAGHIVFVGSLSSKAAAEQSALYSATKFGLRGFSLALRQDMHGTGVGVSIVLPGFVREAGMYADAGSPAQPGVRTVTAQAVARGVLRAITQDRAEIAVAPPELRMGATIAGIAPQLSAAIQRRTGGSTMAAAIANGHQANGKRT